MCVYMCVCPQPPSEETASANAPTLLPIPTSSPVEWSEDSYGVDALQAAPADAAPAGPMGAARIGSGGRRGIGRGMLSAGSGTDNVNIGGYMAPTSTPNQTGSGKAYVRMAAHVRMRAHVAYVRLHQARQLIWQL